VETINGMLRDYPTPEKTIASSATEAAKTKELFAAATEICPFAPPSPSESTIAAHTPEQIEDLKAEIARKLFEKGKVNRRQEASTHPTKAKLMAAADQEAEPETLSSFLQKKRKRYGRR
jgi:hypothetical protein